MSIRRIFFFVLVAIAFLLATGVQTTSLNSNGNTNNTVGLVAGRNVNMVSGIEWPGGDPWLQRQNEPSIAVSTRNPLHLLAGANDYRSIDAYFEDELPGYEKESSARDAWLGVFKSYDGGQSWKSTLLPGYWLDPSDESVLSPLNGFEAAADPVVRAGTNGLFYYSGITFNRGQRGLGQVFVARFIDNNNKETGAIEYIDTKIIDVGNEGHFIDKPSIVVDIPRDGSPMTTLPNGQIVPSGNVYIVYTSFMGDLAEDAHSKMMFSMSTDCGETWSSPTQITDAGQPYQAATLAINPIDGRPHVAYRRFAKDHTDAIMMCWAERKEKETEEGYWHGKIKFSKPIVLIEIDPFDQPTSEITFRTNDYPTMTIDKDGVIYVAWSQRGFGPNLEAKIVMMTSADGGLTWVGPSLVDDPALSGYEFMPSLTSGAGKVMMLWYDQQYDVCGHFADEYIQESYPIRHTIDVRAAEVYPTPTPYFSLETIQVSRYPWIFTFDDPENPIAVQLQHNMPNLRIFGGGTVPFIGDYIDITASPTFIFENGKWEYNTNPNSVYHAVWTDNRDVRPPGPGGAWWDYVAPGEGCGDLDQNKTGIRNQNIYTSRITEGIIAGSPGNTKPLNIDRAFVVFVKNTTSASRDLILEIVSPDATAYFMKAGVPVDPPLELTVTVPPHSSVSATVMVESDSNQYATVRINVYEGTDLLTYILLNPDSTNPFIEDPEGHDPDSPHVGSEGETHTPHVGSEDVINWDYSVDSPHVGSEDATSPHVGSNDDIVTPHVGSDDDIRGGSFIHVGSNNHIIMSNFVNPHVGSDGFDAIPEGTSMTDIVWTVENRGNTTSTFSLSTFPFYDYDPSKIAVQLIVYKVYTTPTALGCELKEQEHHELIVSQTSPHVGSDYDFPSQSVAWSFSDVTFSIPPKGAGEEEVEYKVILRYMDKYPTDGIELNPEDQGIIVASEAPDIIGGELIPHAPALVIKTRTVDLDNGIVGTDYNETLEVMGGYGNYTWTLGGDADTWLDITGTSDGSCYISGAAPTTAGTYSLIVTVDDTDPVYNRPPLSVTKTLSITVRPASPTLTTPAEGAELDNGCDFADDLVEWDFDWSDVSGATKYHLYVKHTDSPLPRIDQEVTASEYHHSELEHIIEANRFNWAWKVKAYINGIWSEWSEERSFYVEPLNTDCPLDTTSPTFTSFDPADDASGVAFNTDLVITFDENVVVETGNIVIYRFNNTIFETIDVTDAGKVSIVDNVVTINPGGVESGTGYYVQIAATCFKDVAENHYLGITDNTTWNFTIEDAELIAYYPFNGNANDESGNANHGTVYGATLTEDLHGNPNSAYAFDGIDDTIEIPDSASFNFNYPITISAWIYLDDNSKGGIVGQWGYGGEGGDAFILYIRGTKLSTYLPRESLGHYELQSNNGLATDQWYMVSMVSTGNLVTLYINGNEDKSEAVAVRQVDSYQTVEIGLEDRMSGWLNYLDGIIDDVRIYKGALTEPEIQALYSLESGLVAHYPFNGDADDESGNGLNGTVSEATLTTDRSGNTNRAYNFDGNDDMIIVSDHALLDVTSQISLSAWIYPTEQKTQEIIVRDGTPTPPYGLALSATGDIIFELKKIGIFTQLRKSGYDLNEWSFITGTYDGTTMKLYVNGVLVEFESSSGSIDEVDNPMLIGTRLQLPADTFKGKLDDIRIYNRVLSADEIRVLYLYAR